MESGIPAQVFEPSSRHTPLWSWILPNAARPYGTNYTHTMAIRPPLNSRINPTAPSSSDATTSTSTPSLGIHCVVNDKDDPEARVVLYEMPSQDCISSRRSRNGDDVYSILVRDTWYSEPRAVDFSTEKQIWLPELHTHAAVPSSTTTTNDSSSPSHPAHDEVTHPYRLRNRTSIVLCAAIRFSAMNPTELVGFEMWIKRPSSKMVRRGNRWVSNSSATDPIPTMPAWIDLFVRSVRPLALMFRGSCCCPATMHSYSSDYSSCSSSFSTSNDYPLHAVCSPHRNLPPAAKALVVMREQPWPDRTTTGVNLVQCVASGSETVRYSIFAQHILFENEGTAMMCERIWKRLHGPECVVTALTLNRWFCESRLKRMLISPASSSLLNIALSKPHYMRTNFDMAHIFSMIPEAAWPKLSRELLPPDKPILVRLPEFQIRSDPMLRCVLASVGAGAGAAGAGAGAGAGTISSPAGVYMALVLAPLYVGNRSTADPGQRNMYAALTMAESGWVSSWRNPATILSESMVAELLQHQCIHESALPELALSAPNPGHSIATSIDVVPVSLASLPLSTNAMIRLWYAWNSSGLKNLGALLDSRIVLIPDPTTSLRRILRSRQRKLERTQAARSQTEVELCTLLEEGEDSGGGSAAVAAGGTATPLMTRIARVEVLTERIARLNRVSTALEGMVRKANVALSMWKCEGSGSSECSSCMDEVDDGDRMAGCNSACGHRLCYRCLGMMISKKTCPVCKCHIRKVLMASDTPKIYASVADLKADVDTIERQAALKWIDEQITPSSSSSSGFASTSSASGFASSTTTPPAAAPTPCVIVRACHSQHRMVSLETHTTPTTGRKLIIFTTNLYTTNESAELNNDFWMRLPKRSIFTRFMRWFGEETSKMSAFHLVFVSMAMPVVATIVGGLELDKLRAPIHILGAHDSVCSETMEGWMHNARFVPVVWRSDTQVSNSAATLLYSEIPEEVHDMVEDDSDYDLSDFARALAEGGEDDDDEDEDDSESEAAGEGEAAAEEEEGGEAEAEEEEESEAEAEEESEDEDESEEEEESEAEEEEESEESEDEESEESDENVRI